MLKILKGFTKKFISNNKKIKAVIFDMDGVLVDSEELIFLAAYQMFRENGIIVSREDFIPYIGTGEDSYLGNVAKKYGFNIDLKKHKARTYEIYAELAKEKLIVLPGVHEFIEKCKKYKLKLAIATSADKVKVNINLKTIGLPEDIFDVITHGEEVVNKKPHPEIYEKTINKLALQPDECIVIEDAINGIKAAKGAGAKCIALTTSFPEDSLKEADWVYKNLLEIPDEIIKN